MAIITLTPGFEYTAFPKSSPHVYLKAKIKNDSEYALLPGPASIFLDNNFITKSSLKVSFLSFYFIFFLLFIFGKEKNKKTISGIHNKSKK